MREMRSRWPNILDIAHEEAGKIDVVTDEVIQEVVDRRVGRVPRLTGLVNADLAERIAVRDRLCPYVGFESAS